MCCGHFVITWSALPSLNFVLTMIYYQCWYHYVVVKSGYEVHRCTALGHNGVGSIMHSDQTTWFLVKCNVAPLSLKPWQIHFSWLHFLSLRFQSWTFKCNSCSIFILISASGTLQAWQKSDLTGCDLKCPLVLTKLAFQLIISHQLLAFLQN